MASEWFISCPNQDPHWRRRSMGDCIFQAPVFLAIQLHSLRQKHVQEHEGFHFLGSIFAKKNDFRLSRSMRDSIFRRVKLLSGAASESGPNYGSPDPAPKMLKSIVFTKGITIGPEGLQIRKNPGSAEPTSKWSRS